MNPLLKANEMSDLVIIDVSDTKNKVPSILDAADFMATPLAEPPQIISGILHQGSKLVLGGGSKSFKTWTLLDLAISVAHGIPWLGRETTCGKVLYVNFEIQNFAWQKRINEVVKAKGITLNHDTFFIWNLRGHAADFKCLLPRIIEEAKGLGLALVVLDPIYKLYGQGNENDSGDMAALMNGMESLAVETGAAVAFGAHFSKGNQAQKEAIDRISGSGVFARDPDSILVFTKHEEEGAFTVESILRNFETLEPFVVSWNFPLFAPANDLDPIKLKRKAGRKQKHSPDVLLSILPSDGLSNREFLKIALEKAISASSFYRLRDCLEKQKKIKFSADKKWIRILSDKEE